MSEAVTDAEAIARLKALLISAKMLQQNAVGCAINHHGLDFEQQGLPGWLRDTKADIDAAESILSYLASRREAQEPIQITMQDVRLMAGEGPLSAKDTLAGVNAHLRMLHRRTAPPSPAPAGEVERLREALGVAEQSFERIRMRLISQLDEPARSAFWKAVEGRNNARAALNGGRSE